jgi:hypothetical protein
MKEDSRNWYLYNYLNGIESGIATPINPDSNEDP